MKKVSVGFYQFAKKKAQIKDPLNLRSNIRIYVRGLLNNMRTIYYE
jgi:hypothetical protein